MSENLKEILADVLSKLEKKEEKSGEKNTQNFLAGFSDKDISKDDIKVLDELSRKIDVFKTVRASYDDEWKKPVDRAFLSLPAWEALICVFLCASEKPENTKGESLRLINSAFNALDSYKIQWHHEKGQEENLMAEKLSGIAIDMLNGKLDI